MVGPSQIISNDNYDENARARDKPPIFDGENFDYWKDKIKSFFLAHDTDLWDMVTDGYIHPVDERGQKIDKKKMTDQQKKEFRNHHKARNILLVLSRTPSMRRSRTEIHLRTCLTL